MGAVVINGEDAIMIDHLRSSLRRACRVRIEATGQGGFVILAGLTTWLLTGGIIMIVLLDMTLSATMQAQVQHRRSQQLRVVDGALETAIAQIQVDPSGRIGQPTGEDDGSCEAGLAGPDGELVIDDQLGNQVRVTATCWVSTDKSSTHKVDLVARLAEAAGGPGPTGAATLAVAKAQGPGNNVTVESWTVGAGDRTVPEPVGPTTTAAVPSSTTVAPTTTTAAPSDIVWSLKVSAEWGAGYCAEVTVTNNRRSTVRWTLEVPVEGKVYEFWNGEYTWSGDTLTVSGADWNRMLKSGASTSFGFCSTYS